MNSIFLESSFKCGRNQYFFNGWGYTDDFLVVGEGGIDEYFRKGGDLNSLEGMEGRYVLAYKDNNALYVQTDQFGSEPLFYFHRDGCWAISNSFMELYEHLVENNVKLTPDYEVLDAFNIDHSICQQLIGVRTLVKEICLSTPESRLKVDIRLGWVSLEKKTKSFSGLTYEELLVQGLAKSVSIAKAILENFPGMVSADITGGYDSRIILGVLKKASPDLSAVNFTSNKNVVSDYNVALELSKKYNFKINNVKAPPGNASGNVKYNVWKYHNLGVYLPVYEPLCTETCWFHFHGGGGEILRDFYVNSPIHSVRVLESKEKKKLPGLVSVMSDFCNQNSLDPDSRNSMREFYLKSRSRLHFGRSSFTSFSSFLVMPILTPEMQEAMSKVTEQEVLEKKVLRDIYKILDPGLLEVSFDRPEKEIGKIDDVGCFEVDFDIKEKKVFIGERKTVSGYLNEGGSSLTFMESMLEDLYDVLRIRPDLKEEVDALVIRLKRKERLSSVGRDVSRVLMLGLLGKR